MIKDSQSVRTIAACLVVDVKLSGANGLIKLKSDADAMQCDAIITIASAYTLANAPNCLMQRMMQCEKRRSSICEVFSMN
jgi:hypothetical protein